MSIPAPAANAMRRRTSTVRRRFSSASAVPISNAVAYWTSADVRAAINGQEDFVIVNIANEPFGNNTTASFTYTVADNGTPLGTSTATVTVNIVSTNGSMNGLPSRP